MSEFEGLEDVFEDEPFDFSKDINLSRIINMDMKLTKMIFPHGELTEEFKDFSLSKEDLNYLMPIVKEHLNDFTRNELVFMIMNQKASFIRRMGEFQHIIKKIQENDYPDDETFSIDDE